MVTLHIPAPSNMLVVNLLGLLGAVGVSVAVGGLAHNWWWSLLVGSAFALGLCLVAAAHAAAEQRPVATPTPLPRSA